jgi:hypothetical protein
LVRRSAEFESLLLKLGWPPPWKLSAVKIDTITRAVAAGALAEADVGRIFVAAYNAEVLNSILAEWGGCAWLAPRMQILKQGIECHIEGKYFSAASTLLLQIEGIARDELQRKPNPQGDACRLFADTRLSRVAAKYYVDVINESFDPSHGAAIPDLSRHAVAHGTDTGFGTAEKSLKIILVLDVLVSGIERRRRMVGGLPTVVT